MSARATEKYESVRFDKKINFFNEKFQFVPNDSMEITIIFYIFVYFFHVLWFAEFLKIILPSNGRNILKNSNPVCFTSSSILMSCAMKFSTTCLMWHLEKYFLSS